MQNNDPKKALQVFNIMFLAMLVGQIMVAGVFFALNDGSIEAPEGITGTLEIVGIAILIAAFVASIFVFQNLITKAARERELISKLNHARTAYIVRWALLEGAALFLLIGFFLTNNSLFMMLFGISIVMFISARISGNRLRQQLRLSRTEMQQLGYKA